MVEDAVAYLRISREDENLENQKFILEKWAEEHDFRIVMFFPDPEISGAIDPFERPAFRSMINYARSKGIKALLFEDISRLARSFEYGKRTYLRLLSEGFKVYFVRDPRLSLDTEKLVSKINQALNKLDDPAIKPFVKAVGNLLQNIITTIGDFFVDIGFAMAEAYLEEVRIRTKRALQRRKEEGKWVGKPSLVVYYAAWVFNKEIKDLTMNEIELAEKQLLGIIMKYWNNPAVKKKKISELLARNELAGLYQRYPNAPKSYLTILRLVKRVIK